MPHSSTNLSILAQPYCFPGLQHVAQLTRLLRFAMCGTLQYGQLTLCLVTLCSSSLLTCSRLPLLQRCSSLRAPCTINSAL